MNTYVGYGVPSKVTVIDCDHCQTRHPSTRKHCDQCGRPSLFMTPLGMCVKCLRGTDEQEEAPTELEGQQSFEMEVNA